MARNPAALPSLPHPSPPPKSIGPAPSSLLPPKGSVDCSTVIYDMTDCLTYVTSGSNKSKPEESYCEGIKAVVRLSPSCVCEALQEATNMKIDINMTRAVTLPTVCNVAAPSIDSCRSKYFDTGIDG
ncbi:hypothetical protein Taro_009971 [Colocasia esculenta]|uniref:Bifunctional inhibitor/plant lipid transfer protein/seed storage helical domain-containing protein n=1 Tax=Colocasia esculenta TaxID=4460 RepID=A0A843U1T4_COLES|nr:hypothetical protein [Colocasia esculenta]